MHRYLALLLAIGLALPGAAAAAGRPRIVGGTAALESQWPSTVFLVGGADLDHNGTVDEVSLCTGSVIAPSWVVTAGHCAFSIAQPSLGITALSVVLGVADINDPARQIVAADDVIPDPGFQDVVAPRNDIALVHLVTPTTQPPIALPQAGGHYVDAATDVPNSAGWGDTDQASTMTTTLLQQAWLPIQDQTTVCVPILTADLPGTYDPATMICAGNPSTAGACHGDSGGPLVVFDSLTGAPVLWGLTSFGVSDSPPCSLSVPVVYTWIPAFLAFIHQHIDPPVATPVTTPPTTPTTTTTTPLAPPRDTTAPSIQKLALSHTRLRTGATLSLRLSEAALVTVTVQRGRTVHRHTKWTSLRPSFMKRATAGANHIAFTARLNGRPLAPGSYRLAVRAIDAAGNRSATRTIAFRVVAR